MEQNPFSIFPLYQSHKTVRAVKIAKIVRDVDIARATGRPTDGSALLIPADKEIPPFTVDLQYMNKHAPEAGGYFVAYEDGYTSFSPAKAFEEGYTKILNAGQDFPPQGDPVPMKVPEDEPQELPPTGDN